jgi:hypothetical protein
MKLTNLEITVLRFLLAGDCPALLTLRQQCEVSDVQERRLTGTGFFTLFNIPKSAIRIPSAARFAIRDVYATIEGLKYPAGFILFVAEGSMSTLEGYSHDEPWPPCDPRFEVYYDTKSKERNLAELVEILPPS